jgi:glycosyltransferase involved in cell wall biosynthesis
MRIALIQSEERQDGAALAMAMALRARGHEATLLVPQHTPQPSTPAFTYEWGAAGFAWVPVSAARHEPWYQTYPWDPRLAAARRLADLITSFDAAWFFEQHWAMPALRARRFRERLLPVIVLDARPDPFIMPATMDDTQPLSSAEYARRWADVALSVSQLEKLWHERTSGPSRPVRAPASTPGVTVCMPYFEAAEFFRQTLESLERQTSHDFTVIAVDDGSRSEAGRACFDACAAQYASRGWKFIRQPNLFPGAARNRAAREASTEFLLFLDSDDIAAPNMVERFLHAALVSGDDILVAPNYTFEENPEGPFCLLYDPPGNLLGSVADDTHGGACIFVRREPFLAMGGFTELRGIGYEDYEFHVRCNLMGMRWDVLPEPVYRYRKPRRASVSRITQDYTNRARVRQWYERHLLGSDMDRLPLAIETVFWRHRAATDRIEEIRRDIQRQMPKLHPSRQRLRLLYLTFDPPFVSHSGWNRRARELTRYFGSRYELTLVSMAALDGDLLARKEAMKHASALREVEWQEAHAIGHFKTSAESLPPGVQERFLEVMRDALRVIPTERFHAAIIDTVFMAEFRRHIDTVTVLHEHNIESQLLRQASKFSWSTPLPRGFHDPAGEAGRLEEYENRTWPAFPLRCVVSETDRADMDRRAKVGRTAVAPNGADPSSWIAGARPDSDTVLFAGHLAYLPNMDAVELLASGIWPEVRKRRPGARLIVAGRLPRESVKATIAKMKGAELRADPRSMGEIAKQATITVAPLRIGSGTRLKILESMAWGLPVVSTTLGCEGIDCEDGVHLLVRDDPKEFAEAIVRLLSDAVLWRRLREAGRKLIRERYAWDRVFQDFESALLNLIW